MKHVLLVFLVLAIALPILAAEETWKNVALVDTMCADKVKANPDDHTTKCAINCAKGGYGILTSDGSFIKFDKAGNKKALAALKATKKEKGLRATVIGEKEGELIKVKTVTLD